MSFLLCFTCWTRTPLPRCGPARFSMLFSLVSVETLATVGYGHMYPVSLYGHLVAMLEIVAGIFGLAVISGLIFVRFSRQTARLSSDFGFNPPTARVP
jgi:ion channel